MGQSEFADWLPGGLLGYTVATVSSYDLSRLDPSTFEHMVVSLALRELGAGVTMFGPGPDGGRDGYFEGEANYPSPVDRWKGRWYIQSKFHAPGLTDDAQKWLRRQVTLELQAFQEDPKRKWPDNWIVITNVDPSPTPKTGTFDVTRVTVAAIRPQLAPRFHIWGGKKVLAFLTKHKEIAERYGEFVTSGNVIQALYEALQDDRASAERIVQHLIAGQIVNQAYAKLEQVGKSGDMPGLHRLFTDVPFRAPAYDLEGEAALTLAGTANRNQRPSTDPVSGVEWSRWRRDPRRARTWFIRGGPGQGKSTLGQFFAQVQRAWFLLEQDLGPVTDAQKSVAREVREAAGNLGIWPASGRIPVVIELKDYAQWLGGLEEKEPNGILTYLSQQWRKAVQQDVPVGMILRLLAQRRWFFVFDGLDEVPQDVKGIAATEVRTFLDQDIYQKDADVLVLCTSRPQGYSGQFDTLDAAGIDLTPLTIEQALCCAEPLLHFQQSEEDAERDIRILTESAASDSVKQLMTTPLQSHIMAVVVRGGHRPPERRWKLFDNFYEVILKREANRPGIDPRLASIFKSHDDLLKTVHNRLGFVLHASAERSAGAVANLRRADFEQIVRAAAQDMLEGDVEPKVRALMEATTDRLVLVNTPDDGDHVRFDVRQLQEFFAAEFLREGDPTRPVSMGEAFELLGADAHWREVTHFLLSALVEEKQWRDIDALASVLQRFDDGEGDEQLVRRRMGRGAAAVALLLAEGVLEQDKRVRGQLRAALLPAFGTSDPVSVTVLSAVNQPQSRNWLIDVLIDSMKSLSRGESIGGAGVLLRVMSSDDARGGQAQQILAGMPTSGLVHLVGPGRVTRCGWFIGLLIEVLCSARSSELSRTELVVILDSFTVLARPGRTVFTQVVDERCNDRERMLIHWLIAHHGGMYRIGTPAPSLPPNFRRNTHQSVAYPSLLAALDAIFRFVSEPSVPSLRAAAVALLSTDANTLNLLPDRILQHIPIDWRAADVHDQLSMLSTASDGDLSILKTRGRALDRDLSHAKPSMRRQLLEYLPTFAFRALEANPSASHVKLLSRRLLDAPQALLQKPNLWGLLIRFSPDLEEELRIAIRAVARASVPIAIEQGSVTPFRLVLPDDAPLLPHLLGGPAEVFWREKVADQFSDSVKAFRAIRDDPKAPEEARLAALVFASFHSGGAGLAEAWPRIKAFNIAAHPWCLDGILTLFAREASPLDPRSVAFGAYLIDTLRDHYRVRARLDRLITSWREHSSAPVTTAGVLNDWVRRAPPPSPPPPRRSGLR